MKKLPILIFLLISNLCYCQLRAVILDSLTKDPIPYVNIWIENEDLGTTSDKNGEFMIDNSIGKNLIFSCLGYETKRVDLNNVNSAVYLSPKIYELSEVMLSSKKESTEIKIGSFNDLDIGFFYASNNTPEIKARFFKYDSSFSNNPFLKSIKFRIYSDVRNARFNIRLYAADENGDPGKEAFSNNIIGIAKKGTNNVQIDLSKLNILFPESGLFISYEWLIIKENEFKISKPIKNSRKKLSEILYEPKVGLLPAQNNNNSWVYKNGKWKKSEKLNGNSPLPYLNSYGLLAIELTLTD